MDGILIVLLLVSALLNVLVLIYFIRGNKKRLPAGNNEKIIGSMEEFVKNMEKKNEDLVWEMIEYAKVRESEFEQRLQLIEAMQQVPIKEEIVPETTVSTPILTTPTLPANPAEGIEPLYKQGFSAKQIAKVLQMEYGEVELAVNMLHKKKSHQN